MRHWKITFVFLLFLGALGGGAYFLFPLEWKETQSRFRLWNVGFSKLTTHLPGGETLTGYSKTNCKNSAGRDSGSCRCVVLIHGWGDSALTFRQLMERPEWAEAMKGDLKGEKNSFQLLALNLPGAQDSSPLAHAEDYRVRNLAKILRQALEPICPKWTVLGTSFGGWVAIWLGLDWKEGVENLFLLSPGGIQNTEQQTHALYSKPSPEAVQDFYQKLYFQPKLAELPYPIASAVLRRLLAAPALAMAENQIPDEGLDLNFGRLEVPTWLYWGNDDRILSPSLGVILFELYPKAKFTQIPKCGHLIHKECLEPVAKDLFGILFGGRRS